MSSPLINKLIEEYHYPLINQQNIDEFLQQNHQVVLFFSENPKQYPESNDVAVVLPELMKVFSDRLVIGVIDQKSQRPLQERYGFSSWPSLVFLRDEQYLGVISQIQNWDDYLVKIERILISQPSHPPTFKVKVVSQNMAQTAACQSH